MLNLLHTVIQCGMQSCCPGGHTSACIYHWTGTAFSWKTAWMLQALMGWPVWCFSVCGSPLRCQSLSIPLSCHSRPTHLASRLAVSPCCRQCSHNAMCQQCLTCTKLQQNTAVNTANILHRTATCQQCLLAYRVQHVVTLLCINHICGHHINSIAYATFSNKTHFDSCDTRHAHMPSLA